jgi:hypothetical protein
MWEIFFPFVLYFAYHFCLSCLRKRSIHELSPYGTLIACRITVKYNVIK